MFVPSIQLMFCCTLKALVVLIIHFYNSKIAYLHHFMCVNDEYKVSITHNSQLIPTVSLYNLEDKQKSRTKPSTYPVKILIGEPKTVLAAYIF